MKHFTILIITLLGIHEDLITLWNKPVTWGDLTAGLIFAFLVQIAIDLLLSATSRKGK
jgi:hypothetical protein